MLTYFINTMRVSVPAILEADWSSCYICLLEISSSLPPTLNLHFEENKAFVGLGSCDSIQTKRKIFKYAN